MKKYKGFTVVELVIVIAIIAVLAAVLIPTFSSLVKSANESADTQLIKNLNTSLRADLPDGKHPTMHDALKAAEAFGYDVDKINASAVGNEILWDQDNDVFCYAKENSVEYIPESVNADKKITSKDDYRLWKIYNAKSGAVPAAADQTNSIYLAPGAIISEGFNYTFSVGIDVGNQPAISSIKYENTNDGKTVVIRTNSANTTLTIDDASEGTINHYGSAGALNIIQCHTASYHEYGKVAFAEITKGRIVLESGSEIKHIHINANENANGFEEVIIKDNGAKALPDKITRDEVTVETETLVVKVESNGATEEVYVYADGNTGSTEKVTEGDNKQNENVNSALGQLVLDNGSESKALSQDFKEAEKTTSVQEAVTKEVEQEIEEDEYALYEARIGKKGYTTLKKALDEAKSGETVVLLKDVDLINEYSITKSITIYGSGYTIEASSANGGYGSDREGRVFDISDVSDLNVSFVNVHIKGAEKGVRGISLYGTSNVNLVLNDCRVTANYYAINVASNNTGLHVTLKNNTFSTGWCAIQSHSTGAVFDILGGTLEGINNKTYNADGWNNFSTIVLNSKATNNTWNFKNVTIKASATTGNMQTLLSNRTTGTKVSFENCSFVYNDEEVSGLENIYDMFDLHVGSTFSKFHFDGEEYEATPYQRSTMYEYSQEGIAAIQAEINSFECDAANTRGLYLDNDTNKIYVNYSLLTKIQ